MIHLSVVVGNVRMVCSSVTTIILKCPQGRLHVRVLMRLMLLHIHAVVHGVASTFFYDRRYSIIFIMTTAAVTTVRVRQAEGMLD